MTVGRVATIFGAMMKEAILAAILGLPASYYPPGANPETREQYRERMGVVAEAIDAAVGDAVCARGEDDCVRTWPGGGAELAAALVTMAFFESSFLLRVHAGRCLENECDAIRRSGAVVHQARSLWQVHTSKLVPLGEWLSMVGTGIEPTTKAAKAAARVLGASRVRCAASGDWVRPTFSAYATGHACTWLGSAPREKVYRRVFAKVVSSLR